MTAIGFATVYHGTYVKDLEPEWVFSLTSPNANKPPTEAVGG